MKTSPIFDEMRAEGARALVLRQGRQKFGKAPTKKQQKALEAITDLAQLEELAERLLAADSWTELAWRIASVISTRRLSCSGLGSLKAICGRDEGSISSDN